MSLRQDDETEPMTRLFGASEKAQARPVPERRRKAGRAFALLLAMLSLGVGLWLLR